MRVEPDGPVPCDRVVLGEAPGHEEQMEGRGFVGKAGRELWSGLERFCGLTREQVYVTNVVKDGVPGKKPKPAEVMAALPELLEELEWVQPKVVIAVGATAANVFLDRPLADLHGIPHAVTIGGQDLVVHPTYHSAAGLHKKGYLAAFAYDLTQLGALLRGSLPPRKGRSRPPSCSWLQRPYTGPAKIVGLDTEGWIDQPWGLSFSPDGQHGYVIRADDRKLLRWFAGWIKDRMAVLHNSLHDVPVLGAMGLELGTWHDTQVLAYHDMIRTGSGVLEAESQNLGTLAYRELGMVLGELEDLPGVDLEARIIPYTDEVMQYAGADAVAARRLYDVYQRRGLLDYQPYQIDMSQIPLVEEMIRTGIPFDLDGAVDYYTSAQEGLASTLTALQKKASRLGNWHFNPGSHPQVRELITKRIGLKVYKHTRGGKVSTSEKALAAHQDHPFVAEVQKYRELQKLLGTYLLPLIEELNP